MKMIYHFGFDSIFYKWTIDNINGLGFDNHFFFLKNDPAALHTKGIETKYKNVNLYEQGESSKIFEDLQKGSTVVFHCLNNEFIRLIGKANPEIKIVWIFWGGEAYYKLPRLSKNLYMPETKKILHKTGFLKKSLKNSVSSKFPALYNSVYKALRGENTDYTTLLNTFKRINCCATFIREDYNLIQSEYKFPFSWLPYFYYTFEPSAQVINTSDEKIFLIGNSGDPANNHADAFKFIKDSGVVMEKAIVPLSYGDSQYIEEVKRAGKYYFGEKFHSLDTFLTKEDYYSLINQCGTVIMNHTIQQAVGNILASLQNGSKVFMNDTSLFTEFSSMGLSINRMKDLPDSSKHENNPEMNRKIVLERFSKENYKKNIDRFNEFADV